MTEKIVGYLYIVIGTALIFLSLFSIYMIFSQNSKPIKIFDLPGISIDLSSVVTDVPQSELKAANNLKTNLVEKEVINEPLNLIAHIILMGFVVNCGFKIASIGVLLLRPIKVTLKGESKSILEP